MPSNILKVSVIIPVFNMVDTLKRTILSALAQPEIVECIVVDDGSTDGCYLLIQSLAAADRRVQYLTHPNANNRGVSASRNLAIRMAKAPFIAFLDADDFYLPDRFANTALLFEKYKDADAVAEAIETERVYPEKGKDHFTMLTQAVAPENMFSETAPFGESGHVSLCGLTVRAETIRRLKPFAERLHRTQDTEWLARLMITARVYHGDLYKAVCIRGNVKEPDTEVFYKYRIEMCLSLLAWAKSEGAEMGVREKILKVLLKFHYEKLSHLNIGRFRRKMLDLALLWRLRGIDEKLFDLERLAYFKKLVFRQRVDQHVDFYR